MSCDSLLMLHLWNDGLRTLAPTATVSRGGVDAAKQVGPGQPSART